MGEIERAIDAVMSGPSNWPVNVRRVFVLTLPISFLLWVLTILLIIAGGMIFVLACLVPFYLVQAMWTWLRDMWRQP